MLHSNFESFRKETNVANDKAHHLHLANVKLQAFADSLTQVRKIQMILCWCSQSVVYIYDFIYPFIFCIEQSVNVYFHLSMPFFFSHLPFFFFLTFFIHLNVVFPVIRVLFSFNYSILLLYLSISLFLFVCLSSFLLKRDYLLVIFSSILCLLFCTLCFPNHPFWVPFLHP